MQSNKKSNSPGAGFAMPSTTCPHCNREIPFEMHEIDTVFECARCGGTFTAMGGAIAGPQDRQPIPNPVSHFRFPCSSCGKQIKAKPADAGKKAHCKNCGAHFVVPTPVTPAQA